ncbi:MAG: hypothetical protein IJF05_05365 [Clostridia bacterium]|nr:hypothetical protein [Clostridia bacterium]
MKGLYYKVKMIRMFSEECFANIVAPDVGGSGTGFTVVAVSDKEITLRIDSAFCAEGNVEVTIPAGGLYHFEKMRTETEEIYGDEYETTVGNQLTVGYDIFATYAELDTLFMAGLDDKNSVRVCRTDGEGNPDKRIAVYLLQKSDNPIDKKINNYTRRGFLSKYTAWINGETGALDFLEKWEADGKGYGVCENHDAYVMRRMMLVSMDEASTRAYSEAHEEGLPQRVIDESLNELCFTGFSYGGYCTPLYDLNATLTENSAVYQFEDCDISCITDHPPVEGGGMYNNDMYYFGRYKMMIAYVAKITKRELFAIHAEIVRRIFDNADVQEYLDSLGFPIVVYYNKKHYDLLRPTVKNASGRRAHLKIRYVENGHNQDGEARDVLQGSEVTLYEGYAAVKDGLKIDKYPRRNSEYLKIEHIGADYIDVRFPYFFEERNVAAGYYETDPPRRIPLGKCLTLTEDRTTTCHKYSWHSELSVTLDSIYEPEAEN